VTNHELHHLTNADLHCHSTVSDGTLEPESIAARAAANGVQLWSLTDHDEVGGQHRARAAAHALGMAYLTGTEVSVTFAGETVHILGLGFDADDAALREGLARTRGGRKERAHDMAAGLAQVGIRGAYEGALKYVGNPELISRTHFARFLVETGRAAEVKDVFKRYLTRGKPGYVPHQWASLPDALAWIRAAGGQAVVAHPGRYPLSPTAMRRLLGEFRDLGGDAIEVLSASHNAAQADQFATYARSFGFAASAGSDWHGPGESWLDLGALPALPGDLTPVWQRW
jgi:predicted metal-dependent phosphoesterase TrpH